MSKLTFIRFLLFRNFNCCFKTLWFFLWSFQFFFFTRVDIWIKIKDDKIWKIQTTFFLVQQSGTITALKIINPTVPWVHFYTTQVCNPQKGLDVVAYDVINAISSALRMNFSRRNKIWSFLVPVLLIERLAVNSVRISA